MLELLFLLLPIAVGYGWVMGRNSLRQAQRKQSSILSKHYYRGLNFLLSEQPDKAVDTLIKMIDINNDTVETHIAMGNFFRHRGELDRAIRVHQNLVSREEIQPVQRENALTELGRDYTQAGFLERAENAYLQLLNSEKHYLNAQQNLFKIYQTTKEWDRAIDLAERMVECHGDSNDIHIRLAHFYCEQAQNSLLKGNAKLAAADLQKAIKTDDKAVRPWLMLGQLAIEKEAFQDAFDCLSQIAKRDINWISEAIPLMEKCAEKTGDWEQFETIIDDSGSQCAASYLAKVDVMARRGETEEATTLLYEQLRSKPTMKGFATLMKLYIQKQKADPSTSSLALLKGLVEQQMLQRPKYRCGNCGFSGRKVYWLCPSCKKWGLVKPIKGLDGE
jgi:lipopolysaccharide biosynthesis regulator YciM